MPDQHQHHVPTHGSFLHPTWQEGEPTPLEPLHELSAEEVKECTELLRRSAMFGHCSADTLRVVTGMMRVRTYHPGDILIKQGEPSKMCFVLAEGSVRRTRETDGQLHYIDTKVCGTTVGSLHMVKEEPCYATAQSVDNVKAYHLSSDDLRGLLGNTDIAAEIVHSLTKEIRSQTKNMRTPLLEMRSRRLEHPVLVTSVAAFIESFYRSTLNALLNYRLTGVRGSLLPDMHIQVPTRILYINGFKGLRAVFDQTFREPDQAPSASLGLFLATAPGVCMTPVSSVLEACNAAHQNPEPLYKRWWRGIEPRLVREVIFGIGLNQLSDYMEERVPVVIQNQALRNALGSLAAGVFSGYLSHIPHNLSTLKLMNPSLTYGHIFRSLRSERLKSVPEHWPHRTRIAAAGALAVLMPKGLTVRMTQIVGSFIILNGTINALKNAFPAHLGGSA